MKKLMVTAAVALAAIVSQGAAITWAAKNIYTPVATDPTKDESPVSVNTTKLPTTAEMLVNVAWVSTTGDRAIDSYTLTTAGGIGKKELATSTGDKLYLDMVADQGSTWKPQYHVTATYTTKDGVYTYDGYATASTAVGNLAAGTGVAATADFSTGTWSYTANAVPEPTSGLLLLLGVAGLALRRRRA